MSKKALANCSPSLSVDSIILKDPTLLRKSGTGWYGLRVLIGLLSPTFLNSLPVRIEEELISFAVHVFEMELTELMAEKRGIGRKYHCWSRWLRLLV